MISYCVPYFTVGKIEDISCVNVFLVMFQFLNYIKDMLDIFHIPSREKNFPHTGKKPSNVPQNLRLPYRNNQIFATKNSSLLITIKFYHTLSKTEFVDHLNLSLIVLFEFFLYFRICYILGFTIHLNLLHNIFYHFRPRSRTDPDF